MFKINGYETNYNNVFIYNNNGDILYKTERPYELKLDVTVDIRNARKLAFNKGDCFEIKTSDTDRGYLFRNGKDLYIHNSVIDVVNITERQAMKGNGETNYKDVYTLKLHCADGAEIKVDSDFYTRTEKTEERLHREELAKIISECLYSDKYVSHYEVERLLEKLDITIKG